MALTIGQFLLMRTKNPDSPSDPYDTSRESYLELIRMPFVPSGPGALPNPPKVSLSSPDELPLPPTVSLSTPSVLPGPPGVSLSSPSQLPPPPSVALSQPAVLPPSPAVSLSQPARLPAPPNVSNGVPGILPPPPAVVPSQPAPLPPLLKFKPQKPDEIEYQPAGPTRKPSALPEPPPFSPKEQGIIKVRDVFKVPEKKEIHGASPIFEPDNGYRVSKDMYSYMGNIESISPGDPVAYDHHVERLEREPGKILVHSAKQAALFAMNNNGRLWNPGMLAPPPLLGGLIKPALDIVPHGDMVYDKDPKQLQSPLENLDLFLKQVEQEVKVETLNFNNYKDQQSYEDKQYVTQKELFEEGTGERKIFFLDNVGSSLVNAFSKDQVRIGAQTKTADGTFKKIRTTQSPLRKDSLSNAAYTEGIVPVKFKYDNEYGYQESKDGKLDDDEGYMPLSFTDMRTIDGDNKTLFFRAMNVQVGEQLSPSWNKTNYFGRVDPVATYQSTQRTFSLQFDIHAFAPEDLEVIFQKIHWLSSMVYPKYDSYLQYESGPVVRLRLGNLIYSKNNSDTPARGLPGIIESLSYDYNDGLWELHEGKKLPRQVKVSLSFLVLHDSIIGLDERGNFGGISLKDDQKISKAESFREFSANAKKLTNQ